MAETLLEKTSITLLNGDKVVVTGDILCQQEEDGTMSYRQISPLERLLLEQIVQLRTLLELPPDVD